MAVNSATRKTDADQLWEDARELARLYAEVTIAFKHSDRQPSPELRKAAESAGLGPRHGAPILTLAFADQELSVTELAHRIGLSLATTSQLVGELSRAGLVERSEDERDRRRTLVRLPEAFRPSIQAMLHEQIAPIERTLQRLSPQARKHFLEGFRLLREEVGPPGDDCAPLAE
jgi:DNA-binding MarR family transcriptional regulator